METEILVSEESLSLPDPADLKMVNSRFDLHISGKFNCCIGMHSDY